jgi:hypothetical protein
MERGNKPFIYVGAIVTFGLTVHNQTLCAKHEGDGFRNVHGACIHFSRERIRFAIPNV